MTAFPSGQEFQMLHPVLAKAMKKKQEKKVNMVEEEEREEVCLCVGGRYFIY